MLLERALDSRMLIGLYLYNVRVHTYTGLSSPESTMSAMKSYPYSGYGGEWQSAVR
jgi:hypothetical protein